jgi:hypothetical protein
MGDDLRVCIASCDLPELMSQQRLTREVSRRLGYQAKASGGNGQVVWYAPSAGSADEIAQVAREVLARYGVGRYLTAPVVRTERVRGDDWRVCIASCDLPELMSQQRLTREVSRRLGYQVKASGGNGQVVWSAPSAGSADEIAQAAREVLAREVLERHDVGRYRRAPVRTERWSRRDKEWRDVTDKPSADIAAELQAEDEARQERERQTSVKSGIPSWVVRVKLPSHRDVVALAAHLAAQGWPVRPQRRYLIVGADCEDDAKGLARALSGDGRAAADTAFGVGRVELYESWAWLYVGSGS